MNLFSISKRQPIYLTDDSTLSTTNTCFPCCTGLKPKNKRIGLTRLPKSKKTAIDECLNPKPLISIEELLAEQEEELDDYYDQTDDEDAFHGPSSFHQAIRNAGDFIPRSYENDAQFLPDDRIIAMIEDIQKK